jgi:uncharacterized membrane protein YeaQ/YmgE (transglycosylase-associated protein family)
MKLRPLIIGLVIGAAAGWFMGTKGKGANALGITGSFARPFQFGIDPGKGVRGG